MEIRDQVPQTESMPCSAVRAFRVDFFAGMMFRLGTGVLNCLVLTLSGKGAGRFRADGCFRVDESALTGFCFVALRQATCCW